MVGQINNSVQSAYNNQFQKRVDDRAESDRKRAAQDKAQAAFASLKAEKAEEKTTVAANDQGNNAKKAERSSTRQRGSLFDQVV